MENITLSDIANIISIVSFFATLWIGSNVIKINQKINTNYKKNKNKQTLKNSHQSNQTITNS